MSQWQYKLGDQEQGPVSFAELVELVRAGTVTETVPVRRAGSGPWVSAWKVEMLFAAAKRPVRGAALAGACLDPESAPAPGSAPLEACAPAQGSSLAAASRGGARSGLALRKWAFAATVSLTAAISVYLWSFWRNPVPPRWPRAGGPAAAYFFVFVGDCTLLECMLLYFDLVLVVGAVAWLTFRWYDTNYGIKR